MENVHQLKVDVRLLYTDYEHVKLVCACTPLNHFWVSKSYHFCTVAVRNKSFDSFSQLLPAMVRMKAAGVAVQDLDYLPLNSDCPN